MFLNLLVATSIITNTNSSYVKTQVTNSVSGDNATTNTEITNNVNGTETHITSSKSGTIQVINENGKTTIEESDKTTSIESSPEIISSPIASLSSPLVQIEKQQTINPIFQIFTRIFKAIRHFIIGT